MNTACTSCNAAFEIGQDEVDFIARIAPKVGDKKFDIPLPDICPDCRLALRTAHRNEQYLYRRTSSLSGESIISLYSPDTPWGADAKIWSHDEWWSESWDAAQFGREVDFKRPFFEQFGELMRAVPRVALIQVNNDNSPYTTGTGFCRNCYLINCSENCEDCYYGKLLQGCRDVMDSSFAYDSELLYQCFNAKKCYNCVYVSYSQNSTDCWFSENLNSCRNCFLSTNLSNKEYHFMNKPMSKEQYQVGVRKFLGSHQNFEKAKELLAGLRSARIYKYANVINCENSTGDFLQNCKNCVECYDTNDSQDCKFVTVGVNVKDVYDCSNMYLKPELCYQVLGTIGVYNVIFSLYIFNSYNVMYSQFCYNSKNLFGCVGLRNKEFCIFNKQCTREEYEERVPRIIAHMCSGGEWGKYFPMNLSPFGYNESVASEYFPLDVDEVRGRGWQWKDADKRDYQGQTYLIPDYIQDVGDNILTQTLSCIHCSKNYKIIVQELMRLRSMHLPVPRLCPDCRHTERMKLRNPRRLWSRSCSKCDVQIMSTFKPDASEQVYCEKCYVATVF